jgi:hypothetical protein
MFFTAKSEHKIALEANLMFSSKLGWGDVFLQLMTLV